MGAGPAVGALPLNHGRRMTTTPISGRIAIGDGPYGAWRCREPAGLGLGFQQGHYALFALASLSAAGFWLIDAVMKGHQMRPTARLAA